MMLKTFLLLILLLLFINITISNYFGNRLLEMISQKDVNADLNYLESVVQVVSQRLFTGGSDSARRRLFNTAVKRFRPRRRTVKLAKFRTQQIIGYYNYPVEVHTVVTDDGYILEIHRIPYGRHNSNKKTKGVVLLEHGFLCTSACWLFLGTRKSLPFILAELGYDVWLGNIRGNTYGKKHKTLRAKKNSTFWDFSFHEIGIYDFPATIDYVKWNTGENKIFFIAHSTTTTSFYVMCSEKPEYNKFIRAHISLAPIGYMKNSKNPVIYLMAQFSNIWKEVINNIGYTQFLPSNRQLLELNRAHCANPINELLCSHLMFALCGFNENQLNNNTIAMIFGHTPAGTSLKTLIHYGQTLRGYADRFRRFNTGFITSAIDYKTLRRDRKFYNLKEVTTPSYCFYAHKDIITTKEDARNTCKGLGNLKGEFIVNEGNWSHNDFVFGNDAKKHVYDKIINILKLY